ncbi:AGE family epimerase/isomerase [Ferruginibacter sp.]|uniref:AGE family epimerase/isomerase n=1 Tax=Ferruginibacter sp. TaxID=1940288 RepID=UPI00198FA225|nr:AGE family epimerase/isomerase [Ferruginibacter sp.]MBC7628205.1 AGE family epimerase/isomerase [Ferruginibacter sp.]
MTNTLQQYGSELQTELSDILEYWLKYAPDENNGGFFGKIDAENNWNTTAPKGAVLNARILWSFAASYNCTANEKYLAMAHRAYQYINTCFVDKVYGGIFWTVNFKGEPADTKKQVYAIAFLLYAYSEYYQSSHLEEVKSQAIALYRLIEQHSFDTAQTGYLEAFTRNWQPVSDLRLSSKDANEKKTMNTHLHILEAYTNLYRIWPNENLRNSILLLIKNFTGHIINKNTGHLNLFFDEDWNVKGGVISYGHDIEAAWLLLKAAEVIKDEKLIIQVKEIAIKIAEATKEGLDKDGGLWYEKEQHHLVKEKHWWPQAEAMIGFFTAWQISGDLQYLHQSINSWQFVKNTIKDTKNGEWFWGVDAYNVPMQGQDKVGLWKCPYHNSRACIELINRIGAYTK